GTRTYPIHFEGSMKNGIEGRSSRQNGGAPPGPSPASGVGPVGGPARHQIEQGEPRPPASGENLWIIWLPRQLVCGQGAECPGWGIVLARRRRFSVEPPASRRAPTLSVMGQAGHGEAAVKPGAGQRCALGVPVKTADSQTPGREGVEEAGEVADVERRWLG